MPVYIAWDEKEGDPEQYYAGGGCYGVVYKNIRVVTRKAQWTRTESDEDKAGAKAYLDRLLADGDTRTNLRVLIQKDRRG